MCHTKIFLVQKQDDEKKLAQMAIVDRLGNCKYFTCFEKNCIINEDFNM